MKYQIINSTKEESKFIDNVIQYISQEYNDRINMNELQEIEVVDCLSNGASGRSIEHKIFLSRINGLNDVKLDCEKVQDEIESNHSLKMLVSTIYHELWHVSTWDEYREIYEYILRDDKDIYTALAYRYWIEYIAHVETIFMEDYQIMLKFCNDFSTTRWEQMNGGYSDYINGLPYFLVRSHYMNKYQELIECIYSKELRKYTEIFNTVSEEPFQNKDITDIEKIKIIEELEVEKLFE